MKIELNTTYNMDCLQGLRHLPDNSVDCCITSPPYYGLRDYGVDGQIGLEKSPDEWLDWFKAYDKTKNLAIIHFTPFRY